MARLIAYLRLGNSRSNRLGGQRQAVEDWARAKRHHIAAFVEETSSAGFGERPGLITAILALNEEGIDGLVVTELVSLDEDLVTQEQLLAEIRRSGKLYSVSEEDAKALRSQPPDPMRGLVRRVLTTVATNGASIATLRSATHSVNGGSPAYGYRMDEGQLVPNAEEQATLARIAELRGAGATLREVARTLEAEGRRPKRAKRWHPEALRRIAQRTD